jgi:ATPase subunit of ABC transporter with duplicated ATPase domains
MIGEADPRTFFASPNADQDGFELQKMKPNAESSTRQVGGDAEVIVVRHGTFGCNSSETPILQDINMTVRVSQLTMIIGPVASRNSTLLKSILGETPSSQGFVYMASTDIAFVDTMAQKWDSTEEHSWVLKLRYSLVQRSHLRVRA